MIEESMNILVADSLRVSLIAIANGSKLLFIDEKVNNMEIVSVRVHIITWYEVCSLFGGSDYPASYQEGAQTCVVSTRRVRNTLVCH